MSANTPAEARTGTVFDIGYQRYTGEREGRRRSRLALYKDSLRIALGLGRGPRAKALPRCFIGVLSAIGLVMAIVAGAANRMGGPGTAERANLTLSPLPRWEIAAAKLLAAVTVAAPFMAVSALVTGHVAFLGDARATLAITVSAVVGVALHASAFVWLGLVSAQAVGIGLLYIVLREGFLSGFVAGMKLLSIRHYAIAVMHGRAPRRFAGTGHVRLGAAIAVSAVVFGGFLFLTVRRLRRMDVP